MLVFLFFSEICGSVDVFFVGVVMVLLSLQYCDYDGCGLSIGLLDYFILVVDVSECFVIC